MLRVTSSLHYLAARRLYTDVRVAGLHARRLFTTLAAKSRNSAVYATFLRRLRYTFTATSECYLTFPVLCQALLTMDNLISLSLDISSFEGDALNLSLQRYGLLRTRVLVGSQMLAASAGHSSPTFERGLPGLRGLKLRGGTAAAGVLLRHRPVEELVLSTPLDVSSLSELCCLLDRNVYAERLVTLIVRLVVGLNVQHVLVALAEVAPNLEQVSIDQPRLDPMIPLCALLAPRLLLGHLRRLSINVASSAYSDGVATVPDMCIWLAMKVPSNSHLVRLSIGGTVWTLDVSTCKWSAATRVGTIIKLAYLAPGV
ncbi:hypothetical protein C8R46DRAFT_1024891 [Mycena filopes]|nr:hypothetical protein C8R46DRAFT_1024891 [Mycena filopes]